MPGPASETTPSGASSADVFLCRRLEEAQLKKQAGVPCWAVFDIDNTLVDTRARTIRIAGQFDVERGTSYFESLSLKQVGRDGAHTCERLGKIPGHVKDEFAAYWHEVFRDSDQLVHDLPMTPVLALVHRAHREGVAPRFLTGRAAASHAEATLAQLHRVGLLFVRPEHLFLKPVRGTSTIGYKAGVLGRLYADGFVAWYLTESCRELSELPKRVPGLACVRLGCSLEADSQGVSPDIPVLEAVY